MFKLKLFLCTLLLTTGGLLAKFYLHHKQEISRVTARLVPLGGDIYVTSQLWTKDLRYLKSSGIKTIFDIRPDGESSNQESSTNLQRGAKFFNMGFQYNPVPHEGIPPSAVETLIHGLKQGAKPAVLYCRTGRRAVRLFALAEASRPGGPEIDSISAMVQKAGFSVDDLRGEIGERILHRSNH